MATFKVTVTCITDNPSINSKIETIEAATSQAARELAEYKFGAARIICIEPATTPQRMTDLQNVVKDSVKRIGVNGMIDLRATYYAQGAANMSATLDELSAAALALGMKRISNWQYREPAK
jgi:hypothetical protein